MGMFSRSSDRRLCPFLKKACIGDECSLFVKLHGTNPQSGVPIEEHICAIAAMPMLQIETTREACSVGAAVESARNEQANNVDRLAHAMLQRPVLVQVERPALEVKDHG